MPTCAICFETITKPGCLRCGHVFDLPCLQIALRSQAGKCPVCRTVDKQGPIELYYAGDASDSEASQHSPSPARSTRSRTKSSALSIFHQRVSTLEEELSNQKMINSSLREDAEDQRRTILSSDDQRQHYERKYHDYKKRLATLTKEHNKKVSQADRIHLEHAQLSVSHKEQEKALRKAHRELSDLADELQEARKQLKHYSSRDIERNMELAHLKKKAAKYLNERDSLKHELENISVLQTHESFSESPMPESSTSPRRRRHTNHSTQDYPASPSNSSSIAVVSDSEPLTPAPNGSGTGNTLHRGRPSSFHRTQSSSPGLPDDLFRERDFFEISESVPPLKKRAKTSSRKSDLIGGALDVKLGKTSRAVATGPRTRVSYPPRKIR